MPYLRMFLAEEKIDEVYISEVLIQSVIGHHTIAEEKQKMLIKHDKLIGRSGNSPTFTIDNVSSSLNSFQPVDPRNNE